MEEIQYKRLTTLKKFMFTAEEEGKRIEVLLLVSQKWMSIKFDTGED